MIIEISDTKTIADIQNEFSGQYPFLKIEFFEQAHERFEASRDAQYRPEQEIGQIRQKHVQGAIDLDPQRHTSEVEEEFKERFGLNVQVYRKMLNQWAQTTGTDTLTLQAQNAMGKDSAAYFYPNGELTEDNF